MYWADEIADYIIKKWPDRDVYRVHDYKTPSGRVHVGALRGVVIHSIVARALAARGVRAEYTYGLDDYDPMDGFPVYLPETFRQYMGQPLSEIPSPEPGYASFAEYFGQEFLSVFAKLEIKPKIVWMSELYKNGALDEAIKVMLDHSAEIRRIYKEVSGSEKPADWYSLNVVCPSCKKIGTTRVFDWDGELVSFKCEPKMVEWAEGCDFEGKTSPFKGNAKMPWKTEWAAKWYFFDEAFESGGKDHMTKGGSFDVASAITRQVYAGQPPVGREFPYEWLLIGGKKMSSSKGVGVSASEVAQLLPAHLLNFLFASTKPNRHLEFNPNGNTLPLLYDEYDRAIVAYNADPTSDLAKSIEYTRFSNQVIPGYTMRFSKVAFLIQMPNVDIWSMAEAENSAPLREADKVELTERIAYAKLWLRDFAPIEMKFDLQSSMPSVKLTNEQKQFLRSLLACLATTQTGADLHATIHEIKTTQNLPPKEAFGAIYQIFLNKDSGPQAGWFLAALDRDFVINRLTEATK